MDQPSETQQLSQMRAELECLTTKQLASKLKECGLPSTGRKQALINRLLQRESTQDDDSGTAAAAMVTADEHHEHSYSHLRDADKENAAKSRSSNPNYCCVPLCHMNSELAKKQGIQMHRIPAGMERRHVRKQWIARLKTVRANLTITDSTRICGIHFLPETYLEGRLDSEAVPSLFPSKPIQQTSSRTNPLERIRSETLMKESSSEIQPGQSLLLPLPPPPKFKTQSSQTDDVPCSCSRPKTHDFSCQTTLSDVNVEDLREDDQKTRFLTGFVNYGTFMVMLNAFLTHGRDRLNYWSGADSLKEKKYHGSQQQKPGPSRRLDMATEFLCVMMWYRLGLLEEHLASIFKVSPSTMSRTLVTWSQFMYEHLVGFVTAPTRENVMQHMPLHFINHQNVYRVDDCTEFFMEKPSGLEAQSLTWSEYKHHNTIKVLVGVTPDGMTTFVSRAWGGRASDSHIVEQEDAFRDVPDGTAIMADKGFEVEDLLPSGVSLIMPPKVSSKGQMSDYEFFKTVDVAEPRIVVEMKMEQAKNYRILQSFPYQEQLHQSR